MPVRLSVVKGSSDVKCSDKYGWKFENGDIEKLTRMITYIMEHFDGAFDKAQLAVEHVGSTYYVSVTAQTYIEEYKRIIEMNKETKCDGRVNRREEIIEQGEEFTFMPRAELRANCCEIVVMGKLSDRRYA